MTRIHEICHVPKEAGRVGTVLDEGIGQWILHLRNPSSGEEEIGCTVYLVIEEAGAPWDSS